MAASPYTVGGPFRPVGILILIPVLVLLAGNRGPASLALIGAAAALAGLTIGAWRCEQIGSGALEARPGSTSELSGFLLEAPRSTANGWKAAVETGRGRVLVESEGLRPPKPGPGDGIEVRGEVSEPAPWLESGLRARGIERLIEASRVRFVSGSRSGPAGLVDSIRGRAERALGFGIGSAEAALARGFVLGQDQAIETAVRDRFRDSGLAHLLAVSGQNVMLLLILAWVLLALLGVPLRPRYLALGALVCLYVPLAGGGPSIQRAGVMGLAGLAAASAGRPLDRVFPVVLAAALTLALNPYSAEDPGWQLSFSAVIGILLLASPVSSRVALALGGKPDGFRAALATGVAVTVAASLATLPLIGLHFGSLPLGTVAANTLALPAVAPSMWLGMVSATVGQVTPWLALPFNLVNAALLAWIDGVARLLGGPDQVLEVGQGPLSFLALTAAAALLALLVVGRPGLACLLVALSVILPITGLVTGSGGRLPEPPEGGLAIDVLDVGQGDAILIRPFGEDPVLVDTGPPGGGAVERLVAAGEGRLGALVLTHLDSDHVGEFDRVVDRLEVGSVLVDRMTREMRRSLDLRGSLVRRIGQGDRFRVGPARVEVLWPPTSDRPAPGGDRNARSIVLLVEFLGRRVLLTGDAEAEIVPLEPGPVDVLKVAHHGSEDAGLPDLLAGLRPALSIVSAGDGNRYGHPVPSTLAALEASGSEIFRTDRQGTVSLLFGPSGGVSVETDR